MKRKLLLSFTLAVAAVAGLGGCQRTPEEMQAHAAVVTPLVEAALKHCDRSGGVNNDGASYTMRLRHSLEQSATEDLAALSANGRIVCLDQRLPRQSDKGKYIHSIYYADQRIVTMPDDGRTPEEGRAFNHNPAFTTSLRLDRLNEALNLSNSSAQNLFAARYYCGKSCFTTRWKTAEDFNQESLKTNPQLMTPPVATSMAMRP